MNCLASVYSVIYVAKKMTKQVATISFIAAVSAIYYLENFWLYMVGVVLAGVYAVGVNFELVGRVVGGYDGAKNK